MCRTGVLLHQQYEDAEKAKLAAVSRTQPLTSGASDKQLLLAKQRYVESFANWLSHRAFCHDCKPGAPVPAVARDYHA
jgi:hypothetical protein